MKALPSMLPVALAAIGCTLLLGCSKAIDFIRDHPGEEIDVCRIQSFRLATSTSYNPNFPDSDYSTITISYNPGGLPISMVTSWDYPYQQTGGDYHFRYDRQGRLTDYQYNYNFAEFGPGAPLLWDRYSYPRRNMIVDSLFAYGDMQLNAPAPPQSSFEGRVTTYTMDEKGRIAQVKDGPPGSPGTVNYFKYDARGNLIQPGVTYDSNVNPLRTSNTWMFISNDYSLNCPINSRYRNFNAYQLPQDLLNGYLFGFSFEHMTINYSCALSAPPFSK